MEDEEGKRERPIERAGHRGIEPKKQARRGNGRKRKAWAPAGRLEKERMGQRVACELRDEVRKAASKLRKGFVGRIRGSLWPNRLRLRTQIMQTSA